MFKVAWDSIYSYPLPNGHRFPMEKYELLPQQLLLEGTIGKEQLFQPEIISDSVYTSAHSDEYLTRLKSLTLTPQEIRKIGFPFSQELIERELTIAAGTVRCTLHALEQGISLNIAGGTHHAYHDRGEGFCILNDLAIATQYLILNKLARRVLIVDLDVHQGNGTSSIFEGRADVFTLSIHGANNYPSKKEKSSLDIGLPDKTGDQEYLAILKNNLGKIIDTFQPDFIFYQSGVDILESDKLGKLSVSLPGCKERDSIVLKAAKNYNIPLVAVMGGGYSESIATIVEAHANTFRLAKEIFF